MTSLARSPQRAYEFYCRRGDQENRIKEMKLDLASGRTICHRPYGQFRLLLHTAACVLMGTLQEALEGTQWAKAQVGTIRTRLLKVGARVVETCRKICFHLPTSFPEKEAWARACLFCRFQNLIAVLYGNNRRNGHLVRDGKAIMAQKNQPASPFQPIHE